MQIDFQTAKITAALRYQTDTPPGKEVAYVKANPLEYTSKAKEMETEGNINNSNALGGNDVMKNNEWTELEVEAKILTLSSQHQGSYFYIHFQLKLVDSGQEMYVKREGQEDNVTFMLSYCELDTPPIQVISKKGQNQIPIQRRKPASDIVSILTYFTTSILDVHLYYGSIN